MSAKYTLEDVIDKLYKLNPNIRILSKEYINAHSKLHLQCLIDGNTWYAPWYSLSSGCGCMVCGFKKTKESKEYTLEQMKEILYKINPNIIILNKDRVDCSKKLKCRCKIDGHEWDMTWQHLQSGQGCPRCAGKVLHDGNRLSNLRPDLIKYFKNKDNAYNCYVSSSLKYDMVCPDCGFEKRITVTNLASKGFGCNNCSDGVSIPEKFMSNVLTSLGVGFEPRVSFNWSKNKAYDFYIKSLSMIIETHGGQHYINTSRGRSLEKEKENDILKKEMALNNGILKYIEVDNRISEFNYLKDKCIYSLSEYFKMDDVDFPEIYKKSCSSKIPMCWDMYNKGTSIKNIAKELMVAKCTISAYVKKGIDSGFLTPRRPMSYGKKRGKNEKQLS